MIQASIFRELFFLSFYGVIALAAGAPALAEDSFRPPAVPLIACDPYFSVWSQSDNLWESKTTHWTGKQHRMAAIVRVDGQAYRLMGATPQTLAALKQTSVTVLPTRTLYEFAGADVRVKLVFTTPALPDDLAILSRPTTYVTCQVASASDRTHEVEFYFDAGGELSTDVLDQEVTGSSVTLPNATALKMGTISQDVLGRSGDDLRIDWGYLYLSAANCFKPSVAWGDANALREAFGDSGSQALAGQAPQFPVQAGSLVAAVGMSMGEIGDRPVSRYVLVAYDDLYSIEYMKQKLRPYWRKDGWEADDLIVAAIREYETLEQRCEQFDTELMTDLERSGGREYAEIAALAYRQCFAAGKFVADANGQPLQFCKENHSNGCIATSDVFYPMAPQFLLFGPTLTKSMLVPFMDYAASERWKFPFAPHDLGTYPLANGQRYGGGEQSEENQMPVEECGNLLALFGAQAKMEGNADFAALYWEQLSQWAEYLQDKGFDPDNQLCTDDFAGHMAHNVNLSAKAICGLGSYAMLCDMRGLKDEASKYRDIAQQFAAQWVTAARDGDHFRLAFDREGTWSQKYNLVWDRLLMLELFPQDVYETEMRYYRKSQNAFGLPLDNRSDYTKLDWILWTATLTENRNDFDALVRPVHNFLNATPDRSPMTDWYFTSTARKRGFTARPVVGGVFMKLLYDAPVWQKYATRDVTQSSDWAPMPRPPKTLSLVATSENAQTNYRYTTKRPEGDWFAEDFDAQHWQLGRGGLGTQQTPGTIVNTNWDGTDIWLRRSFQIASLPVGKIALRIWHDEDAEVYINGQFVLKLSGYTTEYAMHQLPASALKTGDNVIAIHCRQTIGGQFVDFGVDAILSPAVTPTVQE
ncbi:glutaminase family protein [Aureliella helgolandensis]|uniref:Glutaminase A n=1 Tax=Aureliella helgolandensis TaxID=2527968 RepID=A0A518G452_9BACT|nr:glutaminase family protein [Aureliella helgolandensis]QDV23355.1 hypothetical protein Q31a_16530 [Aureliella helgolandensis]